MTNGFLFCSVIVMLCREVTNRNVEGYGLSPFWMLSLGSVTLLPASLLIMLLHDRIGRKAIFFGSQIITGVLMLATSYLFYFEYHANDDGWDVCSICSILSSFGMNVSVFSSIMYDIEVMPTCVRGQGVGIVRLVGYSATIFSTPIVHLVSGCISGLVFFTQ